MPVESINVLVTSPIGEEFLKQIAAVSPRIKVTDAYELCRAERKGNFENKERFDAILADAEIIYGLEFPQNGYSRAPKLKWFQAMWAGVERFVDDEFRRSSAVMTTVSGIHAIPMAEYVVMVMLMFVKGIPGCFELKQEKLWKRFNPTDLRSKVVGIVGLGHIGREVARLAKALGMEVMATRRSAKPGEQAKYVDSLLPREQLPQLLSNCDFVVLSLPATPETDKLIGEKELRTMKPTAYLINVARGSVVDEDALIRGLEENWIAGAGLDVFSAEPLPEDSRLWELPNVIFTPHISGNLDNYYKRSTELFCENLRRYVSGKRLFNVVDKKKGY